MEDESLADVAPAAGGRSVVEEEQQQQQEDDAAWWVHGVNDKHHDQTAEDPKQAGVPREELEGWSTQRKGQKTQSQSHQVLHTAFIFWYKIYNKQTDNNSSSYLKFGADAHSRAKQAKSTAA